MRRKTKVVSRKSNMSIFMEILEMGRVKYVLNSRLVKNVLLSRI